jgi:hypothetical protein
MATGTASRTVTGRGLIDGPSAGTGGHCYSRRLISGRFSGTDFLQHTSGRRLHNTGCLHEVSAAVATWAVMPCCAARFCPVSTEVVRERFVRRYDRRIARAIGPVFGCFRGHRTGSVMKRLRFTNGNPESQQKMLVGLLSAGMLLLIRPPWHGNHSRTG